VHIGNCKRQYKNHWELTVLTFLTLSFKPKFGRNYLVYLLKRNPSVLLILFAMYRALNNKYHCHEDEETVWPLKVV
jgi:hypothetical protein